jgi:Carbamoyltransferase C-terminus
LTRSVKLASKGRRPAIFHKVFNTGSDARGLLCADLNSSPRNESEVYNLLRALKDQSGCRVLVNTSFKVRGELIVCTPEDAFRCFMGAEIEVLAIGDCLLRKEDQDPALRQDYKGRFELD